MLRQSQVHQKFLDLFASQPENTPRLTQVPEGSIIEAWTSLGAVQLYTIFQVNKFEAASEITAIIDVSAGNPLDQLVRVFYGEFILQVANLQSIYDTSGSVTRLMEDVATSVLAVSADLALQRVLFARTGRHPVRPPIQESPKRSNEMYADNEKIRVCSNCFFEVPSIFPHSASYHCPHCDKKALPENISSESWTKVRAEYGAEYDKLSLASQSEARFMLRNQERAKRLDADRFSDM